MYCTLRGSYSANLGSEMPGDVQVTECHAFGYGHLEQVRQKLTESDHSGSKHDGFSLLVAAIRLILGMHLQ